MTTMATSPMHSADPMQRFAWRRRCRARTREGQRCGNWAIPWTTVCRMHGGMAPQVLAKANDRRSAVLLSLWGITEPVVQRMQEIALDPESNPKDMIAALKLLLDILLPPGYQPRSSYSLTDNETDARSGFVHRRLRERTDEPDADEFFVEAGA
jgi:hypothetical protein